MFKVKGGKQHLLPNTQIPAYFYVYLANANNPENKTSPLPFSGSATLAPEWAVTALQPTRGCHGNEVLDGGSG